MRFCDCCGDMDINLGDLDIDLGVPGDTDALAALLTMKTTKTKLSNFWKSTYLDTHSQELLQEVADRRRKRIVVSQTMLWRIQVMPIS